MFLHWGQISLSSCRMIIYIYNHLRPPAGIPSTNSGLLCVPWKIRSGQKLCSPCLTRSSNRVQLGLSIEVRQKSSHSSLAYVPTFKWGNFNQIRSWYATAGHLTTALLVKVPNGVKWRGGRHPSAMQTGVKFCFVRKCTESYWPLALWNMYIYIRLYLQYITVSKLWETHNGYSLHSPRLTTGRPSSLVTSPVS